MIPVRMPPNLMPTQQRVQAATEAQARISGGQANYSAQADKLEKTTKENKPLDTRKKIDPLVPGLAKIARSSEHRSGDEQQENHRRSMREQQWAMLNDITAVEGL